MLKVKRMISEVEIIIGKSEGESKLVNKLIDAENLLTYCMSRLENAIVPPCKVGDTVYCLIDCFKEPMEARIYSITIQKGDIIMRCGVKGYYGVSYMAEDFGKKFFKAKDEAEKALAERMK